MCVSMFVSVSVSTCVCLRVGGCVCLSRGKVSVKSVLFSPVGWICSLQICTACYCNCSHSCCSRCSRLQRRVGTVQSEHMPPTVPPLCPLPPVPRQHSGHALPADLLLVSFVVPKHSYWVLPARTVLVLPHLALTSNSLLFRFIEVLQNFLVVMFKSRNGKVFTILPVLPMKVQDLVTHQALAQLTL